MRAHHVVAAVVILIGIGMKLASLAAPTAEAEPRPQTSASVDVFQMHRTFQHLPVQEFQDMTFVFPVRPGSD